MLYGYFKWHLNCRKNFCRDRIFRTFKLPSTFNSSASTLKLLYMKKILLLSAAIFLLTAGFASNNAAKKPAVKASEVFIPIGNTGQKISLLDLSRMSVKDVQNFTGKKMT